MKNEPLCRAPCPIARSLGRIGDSWSIMILRDAFAGHGQQRAGQIHGFDARVVQEAPQGLRVGHARRTAGQRLHPRGQARNTVGVLHHQALRSPA